MLWGNKLLLFQNYDHDQNEKIGKNTKGYTYTSFETLHYNKSYAECRERLFPSRKYVNTNIHAYLHHQFSCVFFF